MSVIVLPFSSPLQNRCRIGYENLLERGTVTASSENPAYPVENCFDWLTSDYFRPASGGTVNIDLTLENAAAANYLAFYQQDLHALGGTIKLQFWNGTAYVDATPAVPPADNAPRMLFFDSVTASQWRVVITCASVFNIGVIAFGTYLPLEYGMYTGWTPPRLGRANELINSVSDAGAFLGRSVISKGISTTLELQYASDAWVRASWLPFMIHAELKPFFWAPNVRDYPTESAFCWVEGEITPPRHTHYGRMGASIKLRGLVE